MEVASLKVCGSRSSNEVVISTPAANAPRIPMFLLRLAAKDPPTNVEKQVTTAKIIGAKFICGLFLGSGLLNGFVILQRFLALAESVG